MRCTSHIWAILILCSVNTKQFCDVLANHCGYRVVMPDFFRGEPWSPEKMTPTDMPALMEWVGKVGTIDVVSIGWK